MQQEEDQENGKGFELGSLGKAARYGFAALGVFASFVGLVLVVFAYLTLSPMVGTLKTTALIQVDNAGTALSDLEISLGSASQTLGSVPTLTDGISSGLNDYSSGARGLADGVDMIADQMSSLPGANVNSLRNASQTLRVSADSVSSQSKPLSEISESALVTKQGLDKAKTDLTKAKTDLAKAKREIGGVFETLSTVVLIGCAMLALVFIALGAYSAALFL